MKLKDAKTDKKEHAVKDDGWATKMIEMFGSEMPIIKDMPKGEATAAVHFRTTESIVTMAERLVYRRMGLQSPSEVYRAMMHIGACLLWKATEAKGLPSPDGDVIFARIQQLETLLLTYQNLKNFLHDVDVYFKSAEVGILTFEERDDEIEQMIQSFPNNLQRVARDKLKRFVAGEKISDLTFFKEHGGSRVGSGRKTGD